MLPSHHGWTLWARLTAHPGLPHPAPVPHHVLSAAPCPAANGGIVDTLPMAAESPETTHSSQGCSRVLLDPPGFGKLPRSLLILELSTWRNKVFWES